MHKFVWQPTKELLETSRVARFIRTHTIASWQELVNRSCNNTEWFWRAALDDLGVSWQKPYTTLLDASGGFSRATWFSGGELNITDNCVDRHNAEGRGDAVALIFDTENGVNETITYTRLAQKIDEVARGLTARGISSGDVICSCMSLSPESVALMYAGFKLGVAVMQISPRLGAEQVAEFAHAGDAHVIFVDNGYQNAGRIFSLDRTHALLSENNLEQIIFPAVDTPFKNLAHTKTWEQFLVASAHTKTPATKNLAAETVALILFSSGTTGKQKMIVHTHGGVIAQTAKEIGYIFDYQTEKNDVFFWTTDFGWMMAPWELVGVHFFCGTIVIATGSLLHPKPHRLERILTDYRVTIFGTTPPQISQLMHSGAYENTRFPDLRILGSTGMPLGEKEYRWFFEKIGGSRCPIMNISGGTELIGCFVSPLPIMPQKISSVGTRGLGMDVAIVTDEDIDAKTNEEGFLVCRKPFPSMSRGFFKNQSLFEETYFSENKNEWRHGDRGYSDEDGYWFLTGRADDLIVRKAVKIDPVKIEAALTSAPEHLIKEAIAIGVPHNEWGQKIVCFLVAATEVSTADAEAAIPGLRRRVGEVYDPLAKPDEFFIITAAPRTLSGKIPRKKYVAAYLGRDVGALAHIQHSEIFNEIKNIAK